MPKQVITTIIIFLVLVGFGIGEVFVIKDNFDRLGTELNVLYEDAKNKTLTEDNFNDAWQNWQNLRERVELFLNHMDFMEMDLRFAECHAYVVQHDYFSAMAQIDVMKEMSKHIPHMIIPTPEHIL